MRAALSGVVVSSSRTTAVAANQAVASPLARDQIRIHELQTELAHISRLSTMGQMASAIAHELNQPLTAIGNYAGALGRVLADDNGRLDSGRLRNIVDRIRQQTNRAGEVINSEVTKSSGNGALDREALDILHRANPFPAFPTAKPGADDFYVPEQQVKSFQNEMRAGKADWEMIYYADAVHAFTDASLAGKDPKKGTAYNEKAARRSWQHMLQFFNETRE